jgi:hypothetical protein
MSITFDDPPTQAQLDLAAECIISEVRQTLIELAIAIGAYAYGDEANADYARETHARVSRKLQRELEQFKTLVAIK